MFYDCLHNLDCLNSKNSKIGNKNYKTIAMLHKTKVEEWHNLLDNKDWNEINKKVIYNVERFKKS